MQQRLIPSVASLAARTVVLGATWPFRLTAWRWAQRCRATGASVYSLDGRTSGRLLARSAASGWRIVVGPRAPIGLVLRGRATVVVTADDDDLPSPELASAASEVWASSTGAVERLERAGVGGALLMPFLGTAPDLPPAASRARPAHPWRLVCTARPTGRSGIGNLLSAVAELNRTGDPTHLRLVDDGTDAVAAARATVADLGLGQLVELAPLESFAELAAWLDWAHAFVLPAADDGGWPETAEARRAGLVMVVADQPTLRARLRDWPPAELVPAGQPAALAAAVRARLGGERRAGPGQRNDHCDVASGMVAG